MPYQKIPAGGSNASVWGVGGGGGIGAGGLAGNVPIGGLVGVAGGYGNSNSTAWQNSSRRSSMSDLQKIRDRTRQSANATRAQRSTVVQTATQGERFSVETEVVANYNHCHSLTIQYFEVLRHFQIQHRLSSVQRMFIYPFDYDSV